MMMNPMPDIKKVFSLIIQLECKLNSSASVLVQSSSNPEELSASCHVQTAYGKSNGKPGYSAFKGKNQGSGRGRNRVCTHCRRTNHTVETCFLKHGYPPSFKGKGKSQYSPNNNQSNPTINVVCETSQQDSNTAPCSFTQEQSTFSLNCYNNQSLNPKPIVFQPHP